MAHDMRQVAAERWIGASGGACEVATVVLDRPSIKPLTRISAGKPAVFGRRSSRKSRSSSLEPKVSVNYTARLEQIETLMQQYRLHSVAAIFADFSYAQKQDIETVLWSTHTMFNNTYRKVLSRIGDRSQVVQKRKVDKLYRDFLKYSQLFYKGYVQRLAGSYDIPELKQAAYGLEVEPQGAVQTSGDLPPAMRTALVNACYMTLVRLGDLARYRCQHAEKATKGSFDTALTYYGLASMLDPDDGTCHHQMAVLHQIQGQQLEIIYRFHRSISIAKPYALGPGNLQKAFDRHQNQSNSRRGAAKDPAEAIVSWFVKLHAHYAKGKKFSVQRELEDEVLHQLEMSLKGDGSEDVVLKMILINIAAYDIAKENLNDPDKWSMEGSQTCQYILNFNLRTIQVLVRQLLTALQNDTGITLASNQDGVSECTVEFSASLSKLISLCRICVAWLYVTRSDLNAYQDHLDQKAREDVHRLVAEVLTRLLPHALVNCLVAQSKYLLPEDTEIIGLRPLADEQLPLFIDDKITGLSGSTHCRKALKPRKEVTRPHFRPHTETLWRIRDILLCGIYLAASHESPLMMTGGPNGTRTWVYPDDPAKGLGNAQDPRGQSFRPLGETDLSNLFEDLTMASAQHTDNAPAAPTAQGSLEDLLSPPALPTNSPARKGVLNSKPNGTAALATPRKAQAKAAARQSEAEELDMDQMVNDMVDDLTGNGDENDDSLLQPSSGLGDTSYGMNSSTANDIFGQLGLGPSHSLSPDHGPNHRAAPSVSPNGASLTNSIPIPSHPWGYSLSASTTAPDSSLHSMGNGRDVPRTITSPTHALGGSVGAFEQMISPTYGSYGRAEGLGTANPTSAFASGVGSLPGNRRISPTAYGQMEVGSIGASTGTASPDFANAQRNLARDRLASDLFAQYGVSSAKNRPSPGLSPASASGIFRSGPSPLPAVRRTESMSPGTAENINLLEALKSGHARDKANEQLLAQLGGFQNGGGRQHQPRRSGPTDMNNHGGQRQPGYASPLAGGFPNQFTPSPRAIGSPHHRSQGSMGSFEGQLSSLNYGENSVGRVGSPWTFSHPSQIWTGTPATGAQPAQVGMVESNGNYYNGSTAFGRSGEGNNREDPTHFRNKIKHFGGAEKASAYDRAILESALADTHNKPPRK
ncbi:telomerase activating protein E.t1.c1 [Apiospora marii]|uniref:Nonsense-mediated mRNA decay factor n=1 Tax=Apiospora marii TaxID=335849 RepID=A0ABR1S4A8_9PEZI